MMKTVTLPKQRKSGKLSIVRPGDAQQSQAVSRQLAAQEDFLRQSSSPCLIPASCVCEWDGKSAEGYVSQPSGRVLSNIGRFYRGRKILTLEEMLYLSEAHAITIFRQNNDSDSSEKTLTPMSKTEVFCSIFEAGLSQNVYMVYSHLKRLGYILRRHFDRSNLSNSDGCHKYEESSPVRDDRPRDQPSPSPSPLPSSSPSLPNPEAAEISPSSNNQPCRQWWHQPFGPIPSQFSNVRVRVRPPQELINFSSRISTLPGETFTSIIEHNPIILACFDILRPGKRPSGAPDMYILVATELPAPNILRAAERCARGRPVRIAICSDTGGLAFYSSEAYMMFA